MNVWRWVVCSVSMVVLSGCVKPDRGPQSEVSKFDDVYKQLEAPPIKPDVKIGETTALVTLSVNEMPLPDFCRLLASRFGGSVVCEADLDKKLVTLDLDKIPLPDVFTLLSRRLTVQVARIGGAWFVGKLRPEDKGFFVRRCKRLDVEGLRNAISPVLSEVGRVSTYPDGLVIVADRVDVLERVGNLLDSVESAGSDTWAVQLYLVSVSDDKKSKVGVDTTNLIRLSYGFARGSGLVAADAVATAKKLQTAFTATLAATSTKEGVKLIAKPVFLLADGTTSTLTSGISTPVARKTVSDQGYVSVAGYDIIQAGLSSTVTLRQVSADTARLDCLISNGQITGYVDNSVPIQSKAEFHTVAVVVSGGCYLLGSLEQKTDSVSNSGPVEKLMTVFGKEKQASTVQIWAKVYRVAGPLK